MANPDDARTRRLAEALRTNLRRRKAQARGPDGVTAQPMHDAADPPGPDQQPGESRDRDGA